MELYPRVKYHRTEDPVIVASAKEEAELGGEWADSPGAFAEDAKHEPEAEPEKNHPEQPRPAAKKAAPVKPATKGRSQWSPAT